VSNNFTYEHKLIENISSQGWFASPAGRQGYEVILLEQVGDGGTRFYCSLKPGETLRFSERMLGKFTALSVDVRHARSFPIVGAFKAQERDRKVELRANVRYRVTDAKIVAMETVDPLGELRDRVIATLNRELMRYGEAEITPILIERIIRQVGPVTHLGLTVEDAEVLEFSADSRHTDRLTQEEELAHQLHLNRIRQEADLVSKERENTARIHWQKEKHNAINLTDINTLMHEHPDLIPVIMNTFAERERRLLEARTSIVGPAIKAYIEQQREIEGEVDPVKIVEIMRNVLATPDQHFQSPVTDKLITWGGNELDGKVAEKPRIEFKDKEPAKDSGKQPPIDDPRIKFGN
jgi:hypothetical protein